MINRNAKTSFRLIALVLTLLFILAVQSVNAGKKDNTLVAAVKLELGNVDKAFNANRTGMLVQRLYTDGLLYTDPVTMKIKPALALSWKWIDDKTLEFELRKGVKFHDGSNMTADDVVYTLNYVSNPSTKTKGSYFKKIDHAEKVSDYRLRVHLKNPYPVMINRFAGGISIYKQGSYEEYAELSQNYNPNGTGPYRLTKILDGKGFEFEKFEDYYQGSPKGQPTIDKIVVRVIPEFNTQVAEILSGGVDWMFRVPTDLAESLKHNPKLKVDRAPSLRIAFLMMDAAGRTGNDTPFLNLKVRQAVAHAINRPEIVKHLVGGSSKAVHTACHPIQFGCVDNVRQYEYNPEKARQLLKEAGYSDGFETKFYGYKYRPMVEAVMNDLAAVGIKTNLSWNTYSSMRSAWQKNEAPFVFTSWGSSSLADADAILPYFFSLNNNDLSRDKEVADLVEKAGSITDPELRISYYKKALKRIADKAYWVPLFSDNMSYIYNKDLEFVTPQDGLPRLFLTKWKK